MKLTCTRCSQTHTGAIEQRQFVGPYQDRGTGEWIVRCTHCGAGQVVDAPTEHSDPPTPEPVVPIPVPSLLDAVVETAFVVAPEKGPEVSPVVAKTAK